MAAGGKAKPRIPSIPQVVTRGSIWQSATTSHSCQFQPCVKGGALFRVFRFIASGIYQQKVFKLECTNNNKLDIWVLENLKFWASLEFSRHSCPLSALSNPWWTWSSAVNETQPNRWQCCHSHFYLHVFSKELHGCNLPSTSLRPITLSYVLKLFFPRNYTPCSQQTEVVLPKGPSLAGLVKGEIKIAFHYMHTHKNTYTHKPCSSLKSLLRKLNHYRTNAEQIKSAYMHYKFIFANYIIIIFCGHKLKGGVIDLNHLVIFCL